MALKVIALIAVCMSAATGEDTERDRKLDAILAELQGIRVLLEKSNGYRERAVEPQTISMNVKGTSVGSSDAPLTIVEFTDYECRYCRQFYHRTFKDLKKLYIDTNKVRYVVMDVASPNHLHAAGAAEAARCAGEQQAYWKFRDGLLQGNEAPTSEKIMEVGQELSMNVDALKECVASRRYRAAVQEDMKMATVNSIEATPTFVIGKTVMGGGVEGEIVIGAVSLGIIEEKLRKLSTGN